GTMMPGVGRDRGTFDGAAHTADGAKQSLFNHDGDDQNDKREWRGTVTRQKNFANAFDREHGGGGKNTEGNDDGSQRFGFAMTIGRGGMGWTRRIPHPAQNNDRPRRIES